MDIENMIGGLRLDDDDEPRPQSREDDQFPVGMRVLVVDDDRTFLLDLKAMLLYCHYHVTSSSHPDSALRTLIKSKDKFDLVMTAVDMSHIDGFRFLKLVHSVDKDLPVILLSASEDTQLVMKGISNGACDYLLKPVRVEQLKLIWQHVFRIRRTENNVDLKENISVAAACYCCASLISLSTKRRRMQNNTDLLKSSSSTLLKQNTDRIVRFMKMSQKLQADINKAEAVADPITVLATEKMRAIQNRRLFSKAYADAMAARASHSYPHLPMVDDLSLRNEELNRQNRRLQFLQDQCRLYRSGSLSQYKPHIEPIDD